MENPVPTYWFWLDLEMTGLDPQTDRILEAAAIITRATPQLETVAQWESAVYQPPEVLAAMNDWCKKTHGASGLTERVPQGITEADLDRTLCELAAPFWQLANAAGEGSQAASEGIAQPKIILCGNSIGQDRKFVDRYLPRFASLLHYRMLDVSSFKILWQEWYGQSFKKQGTHRALDDIRESIGELKFYLSTPRTTVGE